LKVTLGFDIHAGGNGSCSRNDIPKLILDEKALSRTQSYPIVEIVRVKYSESEGPRFGNRGMVGHALGM
jgi:hypothetical protein